MYDGMQYDPIQFEITMASGPSDCVCKPVGEFSTWLFHTQLTTTWPYKRQ